MRAKGTVGRGLEGGNHLWRLRLGSWSAWGGRLAPWHLSSLVFLLFLALYLATLRPGVLPADSGEFQSVAATAGVAHPPGYPLYSMLAWLFTQVPVGPTPAWRVNLFSAVTAAATVALVFSTARKLTDSLLGGLAAGLALGSATTFWATATKASIRPATAFFGALCVYALVRHASQVHPGTRSPSRGEAGPMQSGLETGAAGDRWLVRFSLAFALGLTHHPSLVFPGVTFIVYLLLVDVTLVRQPRRWLKPLAALLPGLLVLIYLPVRGAPNLATLSGFLNHILARGFRGDMFALDPLRRSVLLPTLLRFQFNRALLMAALLGGLLLLWRDRKLALLLVGSFLLHTVVTLTYDAPQTVEYEMPAYVSLALVMAVPFRYLTRLRSRIHDCGSSVSYRTRVVTIVCHLVGAAILVASVVNLLAHGPSYRILSGAHDTRSYVQEVLDNAPEGAVILSNWHWFTPLRYVQRVESVRPDVAIVYVVPRGEPLAETWVRAIEERIRERPVVVVRFFEHEYGALPYAFEPLGEAFLVRSEPRAEMPSDLRALDDVLGAQIEILGYRLAAEEIRPGRPLTVILAWSPIQVPTTDLALFAQLIGPDGRLWSAAVDRQHRHQTLSLGEIIIERFVVYPWLHAPPGDYALVAGAYLTDASPEGRLTNADGSDVVALETLRLRPSTARPVTEHPRFVRFAGGPTLIGVDHDIDAEGDVLVYLHWAGPGELGELRLVGESGEALTTSRVPPLERGEYSTVAVERPAGLVRLAVEGNGREQRRRWVPGGVVRLPSPNPGERYVPFGDAAVLTHASLETARLRRGTEATMLIRFRSQRPLERDYIVSTSLTGLNDDGTWAWRASHDTVPSLGAIPTLKWIRGSWVLDPHRMRVPDESPAVPVLGSLLLYDHFTQRSLPNLDEEHVPAVKLGTWQVAP